MVIANVYAVASVVLVSKATETSVAITVVESSKGTAGKTKSYVIPPVWILYFCAGGLPVKVVFIVNILLWVCYACRQSNDDQQGSNTPRPEGHHIHIDDSSTINPFDPRILFYKTTFFERRAYTKTMASNNHIVSTCVFLFTQPSMHFKIPGMKSDFILV